MKDRITHVLASIAAGASPLGSHADASLISILDVGRVR
jgi:hypothetical protein